MSQAPEAPTAAPVERPAGRRRRRRLWLLTGVVALLLLGGVAGIVIVVLHNDTTEVSVGEAVRRFERSAGVSGPGEGASALPAPGVYVYDTSGQASVDALNGASHTYPPQTTLTVTREGCGARLRWVGVKERWEERLVCPTGDGLALREVHSYHEFFNQGDERTYTCDANALDLPMGAKTSFTATCTSAGSSKSGADDMRIDGTVIGIEKVTVGAETRDALHVHLAGHFTGDTNGDQTTDRWLLPGGLLAKEVRDQRTVSSSIIGPVTYKEHYVLQLVSTEPRR